MKVLILKPSSLGDVVHALPVLRLMKRQMPGASFYWWLARDLLPLLEDDRDITHTFPFERRRWSSIWNAHELLGSVRDMRALKPDLVLDLQGLARSAAFAWGTNAEKVVGLADAREGATALYDVTVETTQRHAVDRYLSVVKHLGGTVDADFEWLPVKEGWSHLVAEQLPWPDAPLVAICPGARWVTKVWPATHFSDAVRLIAKKRPDVRFVVIGGRDERAAGEILTSSHPEQVMNVAGRTSLPLLVEWLRRCDMLVTNDTGPMHIAAALNKPVVSMFGPTDPGMTGPYGQEQFALKTSLDCQPCFRGNCRRKNTLECLKALQPEWVAEAVLSRLGMPGKVDFIGTRIRSVF